MAQLCALVSNLPVAAAVLDASRHLLTFNTPFKQRLNLPDNTPENIPINQLLCRPTGRAALISDFNSGIRRCYKLNDRNDLDSRIEVSIKPIDPVLLGPSNTAQFLLMFIHESTVPIETSSGSLEVSQRGYALAIRGGADGMWEWNPLTKDLYLSPRLLAIFGYPESFIVRSTDEWLDLVHPEDRPRYSEENSRHLRRETPHFQCEYRIRRADGEWAWGYSRGLAWFDAQGIARRMAGSITDISARKQAEAALDKAHNQVASLNATLEHRVIERTRELAAALDELRKTHSSLAQAQGQLVQAETLASLGRMVAVIAHELNTPIGNSRVAASTLHHEAIVFIEKIKHGLRRSELESFIKQLETGTRLLDKGLERAADLIASFKQVAADQTSSQRRVFSLDLLLMEIRTTLEPSLKRSGCKVDWQTGQELKMDSYPGPLGQVLMNLINNAVIHAFEGRKPGNLWVRTHDFDCDHIRIEVQDDGNGIPNAYLHRVFEPFFTTRMGRGGTGLGLSISHRIVTHTLGGQLLLDSTSGLGSRFSIVIPRIANTTKLPSGTEADFLQNSQPD